MPLLGQVALWLALLAAVWAVGTGVGAARTRRPDLATSAERAATAAAVALIVALGALTTAVWRQDYLVAYVAAWSDRALSAGYRWATLYAGPEGRLLCWTTAVAIAGALTARRSRPVSIAVLGAVVATAALLLLVAENPFGRLGYTPVDGRGLPAELQDPAVLLYPPALYVGFAIAMVPFAEALAAVPSGAREIEGRKAAIVAWTILSAAIGLGWWWAYRRLGWGESWIIDPVRNQSLPAWFALGGLVYTSRPQLRLVFALLAGVFAVWGMFAPSAHAVQNGAALITAVLLVVAMLRPAVSVAPWARRLLVAGSAVAILVLAAQPLGARASRRLAPGQSVELSAWGGRQVAIGYLATSRYPVVNRIVVRALLEVRRGDRVIGRIGPEQRQYFDIFGNDTSEPVRRPAALHRLLEDVYASLEGIVGADDAVVVRVAVNPLLAWLWVGCGLLVAAGVVIFVSESRRSAPS